MPDFERETTIIYSGGAAMDGDLFDDLVDLYAKYGLTIEVTTDGWLEGDD